jgi:addiction module HigA family antidote
MTVRPSWSKKYQTIMSSTRFDNQITSDLPIPPGFYIKELLEERDWTQGELAKRMGRPVQAINEIVNGKKAITAETALQLEKTLGMSAEAWMGLESDYRLALARQGGTEAPALTILQVFVDELEPDDPARGYSRFLEYVDSFANRLGSSSTTLILRTVEALRSVDPAVIEWKTTVPPGTAENFEKLANAVSK